MGWVEQIIYDGPEAQGRTEYEPPTNAKNATKKLGRPKGSYKDRHEILSPTEQKVVLLKASGMSAPAIAIQLEMNAEQVYNVLERSHVAKAFTRVTAQMCGEIAPVARAISEELEAVAGEAFDTTVSVMRDLNAVGDEALAVEDLKNGIRAKLGALTSAQDILDRAGKRAPTRTIGAMVHAIAPEQLEKLERIVGDVTKGD